MITESNGLSAYIRLLFTFFTGNVKQSIIYNALTTIVENLQNIRYRDRNIQTCRKKAFTFRQRYFGEQSTFVGPFSDFFSVRKRGNWYKY